MACNPEVLKHVPLFALLDEDETAVLAGQVELKNFAPRQRIYKMGDPGGQAYVMVSGRVRVTTVDEDQQEVVVDEPAHGEFFGFASITSFGLRIARTRTSCCAAWNCRPSTVSMSIPACGLRCSSVAMSPRLTSRHTVSSTAVALV